MTHATNEATLASAPTPVGVRHHCVWCGVAVRPVRHARPTSLVRRLTSSLARRAVNNYRLTALRRDWLPATENEPEAGYVRVIARESSKRLMAAQVVAFPVILALTGLGGVAVGLMHDHGALAHCLRESYVTVFTGAARACAHHATRLTELPIYLDIPSALGAASALGMWILHRRLTFLMLHVPPQDESQPPGDGPNPPPIESRFGRGWHRNALSDPARKRFFLFQEDWALTDPFRLNNSWVRRGSLLFGLVFAGGLFTCYYFFGAPFRNVCDGASRSACDAFRSSWWASPLSHPALAAGWIMTVAIAATFGLDNFMTTSEFQHYVGEALSRPPVTPPPDDSSGRARTARLTEHFPDLPSSWTFLQAFLAEVRLGSVVGLASLTSILAMFFLGATGTEASLEYAASVIVVGVAGVALLARRRRFESTLTTAANHILASEVEKVLRMRDAAAAEDDEAKKEANERMEWLIAHGSLPPIKLEVRMRTYIGWAVVAAGLFLTLYQSVR